MAYIFTIRRWKAPLRILIGYVIIVFLSAPSVWLNWQSVTIGWHEDVGIFLWNMWWMRKAVVELHASPFYTAWLNYPDGANLWFHTLAPLPSFLSIPLQEYFGLIGAYNMLLFTSMVASAVAACWLAYTITKNYPASFIAGLVFAFAPTQVRHILLGQINLIAIYFIPLYIVFYMRYLATTKRMYLLATTLILVFSLLNDWHFGLFLGLFTSIFLLARIIFHSTPLLEPGGDKCSILTLFRRTFWVWATCCIVLSPFIFTILTDTSLESTNAVSSSDKIIRRSADILAFFIPTPRHPLWAGWAYNQHTARMEVFPSVVSLSLAALPLSALAVITRWQQARFWVFGATIFVISALGPELRLMGHRTGIPLPYDVLSQWEILRIARSPARFTLLVMLCVSMLTALGTATILEKIPTDIWKGIVGILITAVLCFELVFPPIQGRTLDTLPAFYTDDTLKGTGALIELRDPQIDPPYHDNMYLATLHERPVLFGQLARESMPSVVLNYLRYGLIQYEEHDMVDPLKNWQCLANTYRITHLAIYRHEWQDEFPIIQQKLTVHGFLLMQTTSVADLYHIPHHNNASSCVLLRDGWSTPRLFSDNTTAYRWMDQSATLEVFNSSLPPNDQDVTFQFQAHSFAIPRHLQVYVDGVLQATYPVDIHPSPITLQLENPRPNLLIELRSVESSSNPSDFGYEENMNVSIGFSKMRVIPSQ